MGTPLSWWRSAAVNCWINVDSTWPMCWNQLIIFISDKLDLPKNLATTLKSSLLLSVVGLMSILETVARYGLIRRQGDGFGCRNSFLHWFLITGSLERLIDKRTKIDKFTLLKQWDSLNQTVLLLTDLQLDHHLDYQVYQFLTNNTISHSPSLRQLLLLHLIIRNERSITQRDANVLQLLLKALVSQGDPSEGHEVLLE